MKATVLLKFRHLHAESTYLLEHAVRLHLLTGINRWPLVCLMTCLCRCRASGFTIDERATMTTVLQIGYSKFARVKMSCCVIFSGKAKRRIKTAPVSRVVRFHIFSIRNNNGSCVMAPLLPHWQFRMAAGWLSPHYRLIDLENRQAFTRLKHSRKFKRFTLDLLMRAYFNTAAIYIGYLLLSHAPNQWRWNIVCKVFAIMWFQKEEIVEWGSCKTLDQSALSSERRFKQHALDLDPWHRYLVYFLLSFVEMSVWFLSYVITAQFIWASWSSIRYIVKCVCFLYNKNSLIDCVVSNCGWTHMHLYKQPKYSILI